MNIRNVVMLSLAGSADAGCLYWSFTGGAFGALAGIGIPAIQSQPLYKIAGAQCIIDRIPNGTKADSRFDSCSYVPDKDPPVTCATQEITDQLVTEETQCAQDAVNAVAAEVLPKSVPTGLAIGFFVGALFGKYYWDRPSRPNAVVPVWPRQNLVVTVAPVPSSESAPEKIVEKDEGKNEVRKDTQLQVVPEAVALTRKGYPNAPASPLAKHSRLFPSVDSGPPPAYTETEKTSLQSQPANHGSVSYQSFNSPLPARRV